MLKEDWCLFLYAGTYFLKEYILLKTWIKSEGIYVSLGTINLDDEFSSPKWNAFKSTIQTDKMINEFGGCFDDGAIGYHCAFVLSNGTKMHGLKDWLRL